MTTKTSLSALLLVSLGAFAWACTDDLSIDGSKVLPVGSATAPPSCGEVCSRLAALCGYAPAACVEMCAAAPEEDGWDDAHRLCKGTAPSCRDGLACANEPNEPDDEQEAAADLDAGGD